ncbi:MAG: hypothetical protein E7632_13115 [Ruminococcaceae bacterium]|nr:hypothetical protein [Oscillospiraceae bacterium]
MKRLFALLTLALILVGCASEPISRDKTIRLSGELADTAEAVYFLAGEAAYGTREIFAMDKDSLAIESTGKSGRVLFADDEELYICGDTFATLSGETASYAGMNRFLISPTGLLFYPRYESETYILNRNDGSDVRSSEYFPLFDPAAEEYTRVWAEELGDGAFAYEAEHGGKRHRLAELSVQLFDAMEYFQLYRGIVYVSAEDGITAVKLKNGARTDIFADGTLMAAAHERLFIRQGEDLVITTLSGAELGRLEAVYADGAYVYADSCEPVVYVIDPAAMTAEAYRIL